MKTFEETWRWFGPPDPVTLGEIRQTGARGVVTALHHIPNGAVWPEAEIVLRKETIEKAGLEWTVAESVPVHEHIKQQRPGYEGYIDNYCRTIRNLGKHGIRTICYNFMPILDWTRTNLQSVNADGSISLQFDPAACLAFELFILKRNDACHRHPDDMIENARLLFDSMAPTRKKELENCILAGLPGSEERYSLRQFSAALDTYRVLDTETYRSHLFRFLEGVIPEAEKAGVRMAIHPDDPPIPLFGLPRIASTPEDFRKLVQRPDSPCNGITFCTGSLGSRPDNPLSKMVRELAHRIHFLHLRNVSCTANGGFTEVNHLSGDADLYDIMKHLIIHQQESGRRIPLRPDHGLRILGDLATGSSPGYPLAGRLKGLAEIRGMGFAIEAELGIR